MVAAAAAMAGGARAGTGPARPSFGRLLRIVDADVRPCDTDEQGCGALQAVERSLRAVPPLLTVVLAWESGSAEPADIRSLLDCVDTELRVRTPLVEAVEKGLWLLSAPAATTTDILSRINQLAALNVERLRTVLFHSRRPMSFLVWMRRPWWCTSSAAWCAPLSPQHTVMQAGAASSSLLLLKQAALVVLPPPPFPPLLR